MNKKQADKHKIIAFAKELYMVKSDENPLLHKYSLRQITDEIKRKMNKDLVHSTILNWIKRYEWDKQFSLETKQEVIVAIQKEQENNKINKAYKKATGNQLEELLYNDLEQNRLIDELVMKSIQGEELTTAQLLLIKRADAIKERIIKNMNVDGTLGEKKDTTVFKFTIKDGDLSDR